MSKFHTLYGGSSPQIFCAKLTEIADEIENIACVVAFKDGKSSVFSTSMSSRDITWLRWVFDKDFDPDNLADDKGQPA